jgi:hypothetical protein
MQLLDRQLPATSLTSRRTPVCVPDVGSFTAAFVTNARGIAAVGQIDGHVLAVDAKLMTTLIDAYQSASWDPI